MQVFLRRGRSSSGLRWRFFLTILAGGMLLSTGACSRRKTTDLTVLRMPLFSEPPSLDPQLADTGISVFILDQVISTLFKYDSERGIRPYDAESYQWKSDGMELYVKVRKGLTWSDGQPLLACQYRDAVLRALDPKVPAAMAELLFEILNAPERKAGKVPEDKVRILCDDKDNVIRFFVSRAYSWRLLHGLAFVISAPIRKDVVHARASEWLFPTPEGPGLSTGAFAIKEWSHGRRLTLEARGNRETTLPEDRKAHFKTVEFPFVKDPATALALYENGEVDVLGEIPPAWNFRVSTRADYRVFPFFTTYMIGFSLKDNPVLKDARVRQALAYSLNVDEIPALLGGAAKAARGWIPPDLLVREIRPQTSLYQPDRARKLLAQAGFKGGKKFPLLKLFFNTGDRHQLLMERAAYNWKKELGIQVELNPMEWKVLTVRLRTAPPDLYRYAWAAVYPDPLFFLELFVKGNPNNFGGWSDPAFDAWVLKLAAIPLERRDAVFWKDVQRAQAILVDSNPALIPVYHYVRGALISPQLVNFSFDWRGSSELRLAEKVQAR